MKRAAYDEQYKAKLARKRRVEEMDRQRRLDREKLEQRELEAKRNKGEKLADAAVGVEIERQREENARRLREMQRETVALTADIQKQADAQLAQEKARLLLDIPAEGSSDGSVVVKWKIKRNPNLSSLEALENLFKTFGPLEHVVMLPPKKDSLSSSSSKKSSALIVFKSILAAVSQGQPE